MPKRPYDRLVGKLIRINTAAACGLIKGDVISPIRVSYVRGGRPLIWWVDQESPEVTRSMLLTCPTHITLIEEDEQKAINAVMGQIQDQLGKLDLTIYSPRVKLVYMNALRYFIAVEFVRRGT